MEYMIANVTKVGGTVVQTEDEIVMPIWQLVLIMQVSEHSLLVGPGLSLMMEAIGLSGMTETPFSHY